MPGKNKLLILVFFVIISVSLIVVLSDDRNPFFGKNKDNYHPGVSTDMDIAVARAQQLFQERKKIGEDFSKGPCLTNDLLPNWVADIVHNPRTEADNIAQNQCQAYREGRAKHFIELDMDGNVVRAK